MRQLAAAAASSASSLPSSLEDYTSKEVQDMEGLILSLSREATDASRRARVEALFRDAALVAPPSPAAEDNNDSEVRPGTRFSAALFNLVLISVGNRVQEEAQQRSLQAPPSTGDDGGSVSMTPEAPAPGAGTSSSPPGALADNFQLWALVDMMVQSKTIVKRLRGELGKEGSFG
jgi:hypothetical protein